MEPNTPHVTPTHTPKTGTHALLGSSTQSERLPDTVCPQNANEGEPCWAGLQCAQRGLPQAQTATGIQEYFDEMDPIKYIFLRCEVGNKADRVPTG